MHSKEAILQLIHEHKDEMKLRFTVRRVGLFGSYSRDAARIDSDIDILVELNDPTFDHYMELKFYLEDLLGTTIDLILADDLKPRLLPYVEQDVIYA